MAVKDDPPPVRHFRNWQDKGKQLLDDMLHTIDVLYGEYQKQARRQLYFQRMYRIQVRRQHDLRRAYERKLWRERALRRAYERKLRHEHNLRRAYEELLHRQNDYYEQRLTAAAASPRSRLYSCKMTRLVAVALSTDSEPEAAAALAKARKLHHLTGYLPAS
jgi:hypothetical protein